MSSENPCLPCAEPIPQMGIVQIAVVIVLIMMLVCVIFAGMRVMEKEGFKARTNEIYHKARDVFKQKGENVPYSTFKDKIPNTDPVEYTDLRGVWRKGGEPGFTMEKVDTVM